MNTPTDQRPTYPVFKYAKPLVAGGVSAKVDGSNRYLGSWVLLGDEYTADLISIGPDEARALRDWLNEVLP